MALAINQISAAMLESDPEKAKAHLEAAEAALAKFKDAFVREIEDQPLNFGPLVP